jgi:hypothetical protein
MILHVGSKISGAFKSFRNSKFKQVVGQVRVQHQFEYPKGGDITMGMYPNVPYRPVPGLVVLFDWVSCFGNPRAPLTHSCIVTGFSYAADAINLVDNIRGSRGNGTQQWFSGLVAGQGTGQGVMFDRGGFPPTNPGFHPGYVSRGPYTGHNGG